MHSLYTNAVCRLCKSRSKLLSLILCMTLNKERRKDRLNPSYHHRSAKTLHDSFDLQRLYKLITKYFNISINYDDF